MFGPPGHLYVYFSYGMHWAANIICGPDGVASGVLLRAGEVVDGVDHARSRRGRSTDRDLARGPGRLTQALGLNAAHKGCDLLSDGPVRLEPAVVRPKTIMTGPRVGVSAEADRPWRFWDGGQPRRVGLQAQPPCPHPVTREGASVMSGFPRRGAVAKSEVPVGPRGGVGVGR